MGFGFKVSDLGFRVLESVGCGRECGFRALGLRFRV